MDIPALCQALTALKANCQANLIVDCYYSNPKRLLHFAYCHQSYCGLLHTPMRTS